MLIDPYRFSAAAEAGCDPYWSYVKTLLHFDGNTTDSSTAGVTYANGSGAVIASSGQLYGSGALDCRPSNSASCVGSSAALVMGSGDFCIECWFRDENQGTKNQYVWQLQEDASGKTVRVYSPSAGNISCDVSGGGPVGSVAYSYNTWIHSAVTRSGNNWTHWIDGVAQQTWTNSTFTSGTSVSVWVGSGSAVGSGLMCLIDEFRATIGVPRYTAPFTPTGPFDEVACDYQTVALLHFNGTNGSTTYTDELGSTWESGTPPFSNATISTAQSKFGGASLSLANDMIFAVAPFGADVDLPGDFTAEGWVYMTAANYVSLLTVFDGISDSINAYFDGSTLGLWHAGESALEITDGTGFLNQWVHWFVGRSGSTKYAGLNGLVVSAPTSVTPPATVQLSIGDPGGETAYVDEFRIMTGVCNYTGATYTVPTAAFTYP